MRSQSQASVSSFDELLGSFLDDIAQLLDVPSALELYDNMCIYIYMYTE